MVLPISAGKFFEAVKIIQFLLFVLLSLPIVADSDPHSTDNHSTSNASHVEEEGHDTKEFDPVSMIMHHIADAHEWHILDLPDGKGGYSLVSIPLPVILFTNGNLDIFMYSAFEHGHAEVVKGNRTYFLDEHHQIKEKSGSSILDFSISKNVVSLFISCAFLLLIFSAVARSYKKGLAPGGLTAFIEPLVLFVRDDIAIPNIGEKKAEKFLPYLLTVFFLIWINNVLGLIPFFPGGANLTGNISFTLVLAFFTLVLTNLYGNKDYWKHIFMPPGVPLALYPIMIPVEILGIITKPFALMIRLFANITAGHILILSLVSLIFIFKSIWVSPISVAFILFMNCLELFVAALQAYIFTLLSALFIGMAVAEHHHEEEHAHEHH